MIVSHDFYQLIIGQSQMAYPEETGGLLLGNINDSQLVVEKVLPLSNIRPNSRHNRIEIDPLDYAKAERVAMSEKMGVWGFYHSHPDADAIPSEFDRQHFPFTQWWYPIISIKKGEFSDFRCWKLNDSREDFSELSLHIPA